MAIHLDLARKVTKILLDRGKTRADVKGYFENGQIQQQQTDEVVGPVIKTWDIPTLGAVPTIAELDAMDSDQTYTDFKSVESGKAGRPAASRVALKNRPLLKTVLLETDAATLARSDSQKINIAVLMAKHLLIMARNEDIEDMQA